MESTLSFVDKGNAVCSVLLNLSKAFDYVDRKILLKLEYISINGKMPRFKKSYLTEKIYCYFLRVWIRWEGIEVGVPQGFSLGTTIVLVYINDQQNNTSLLKY